MADFFPPEVLHARVDEQAPNIALPWPRKDYSYYKGIVPIALAALGAKEKSKKAVIPEYDAPFDIEETAASFDRQGGRYSEAGVDPRPVES